MRITLDVEKRHSVYNNTPREAVKQNYAQDQNKDKRINRETFEDVLPE